MMTVKDRMLAVLQGREHDRVPFAQYVASGRFCQSFPLRDEVAGAFGAENVGFIRLVGLFSFHTPNCRWHTESLLHNGRDATRHTITTPKGNINEIRIHETTLHSTAAATHFVKTPDDYEALLAYLRDIRVVKDLRDFSDAVSYLGDYGLTMCYLPRSPYQQLWIEWVDMRDLAVHFAEAPGLMQEVVEEIRRVNTQVFRVICEIIREAPIPYLVFGDNLTAPMIGDANFRAYNIPAYNELAGMIEETGRDVPVLVHTDGYLKPLWEGIGETRISGLESLSPPPDNDTTVADAISRWPHMRFLVNFPSPAHLFPPEAVYATAMRLLEDGGRRGKIQIQVSEDIPPGIWRKSYPSIIRAIQDFGAAC